MFNSWRFNYFASMHFMHKDREETDEWRTEEERRQRSLVPWTFLPADLYSNNTYSLSYFILLQGFKVLVIRLSFLKLLLLFFLNTHCFILFYSHLDFDKYFVSACVSGGVHTQSSFWRQGKNGSHFSISGSPILQPCSAHWRNHHLFCDMFFYLTAPKQKM